MVTDGVPRSDLIDLQGDLRRALQKADGIDPVLAAYLEMALARLDALL